MERVVNMSVNHLLLLQTYIAKTNELELSYLRCQEPKFYL